LIWLTLPGTIVLHLVASICLIVGYGTQEAALALALFTVLATLKVHAYWRLPEEQQLPRSRITMANPTWPLLAVCCCLWPLVPGKSRWLPSLAKAIRQKAIVLSTNTVKSSVYRLNDEYR
jgi:uncharacterized membrane protein YphA (DoxX/SURF4 family)